MGCIREIVLVCDQCRSGIERRTHDISVKRLRFAAKQYAPDYCIWKSKDFCSVECRDKYKKRIGAK